MPFVLLYLVVEIVALVAVGSWIGAGWTLLVLLTGTMLGLWFARREGLRTAIALGEAARSGKLVHAEMTDGMLVALGGLLLVVPGLITDLLGLLLVLPPTRAIARRRLVAAAERRNPALKTARIRSEGPVIDAEVIDGEGDGVVVDGVVADAEDAGTANVPTGPKGRITYRPSSRQR